MGVKLTRRHYRNFDRHPAAHTLRSKYGAGVCPAHSDRSLRLDNLRYLGYLAPP